MSDDSRTTATKYAGPKVLGSAPLDSFTEEELDAVSLLVVGGIPHRHERWKYELSLYDNRTASLSRSSAYSEFLKSQEYVTASPLHAGGSTRSANATLPYLPLKQTQPPPHLFHKLWC